MGRRRHGWRVVAGLLGLTVQAGCLSLPRAEPGLSSIGTPMGQDTMAGGDNKELPPAEAARACIATGDVLSRKGHDREAIGQYERARQKDPSQKQVCRRLAVLYDRQGDFQRAMAEYRKALELSPTDPNLHNDLGYCHYSRGRWDEAEKHLRKALELDPKHKRAWVNLGLALGQQGRYEESLKAFAQAVPPAQARANVAFLLAGQGKHEEAKRVYREALELDPNLALARAALAKLEDPTPPPAAKPPVAKGDKPIPHSADDGPSLGGGRSVGELQPAARAEGTACSEFTPCARPDVGKPVQPVIGQVRYEVPE